MRVRMGMNEAAALRFYSDGCSGTENRGQGAGKTKLKSLLDDQEAGCRRVVAGAGFAEYTTIRERYWISLK